MEYEVFRETVLAFLEEDKEWTVHAEWQEVPAVLTCGDGSVAGGSRKAAADASADSLEDFIELEQEKGPFYEFMTISVNRLYFAFMGDGWDATLRELEKFTRRGDSGAKRKRSIDYEARLNEDGAILYGRLRELRRRIAAEKQVPPYIVFMNRSLYEMCCRQPATMDELLGIYGVGRKNSSEYGEQFLEEIRKHNGGCKAQVMKIP